MTQQQKGGEGRGRRTVVSVEDLELLDRLEVLEVRVGHLGNLEQSNVAVDVDELEEARRQVSQLP